MDNDYAHKMDQIAQIVNGIAHTDWRRRQLPEFLEWLENMEDLIEQGRKLRGDI